MIAEIICVGTARSILGSAVSTDAQIFARELALLGIELRYQTTAGNQKNGLAQAMSQALRRSDIIITLGGVGFSPEDYTREVICKGLQIPVELHAESYQRIQNYCEAAGLPTPPSAQQVCMMPRGGAVFPGDRGGAPGCAVTAGDQCIVMLPGEAAELVPMFMASVYPFLAQFAGAIVVSRLARVFGPGEREVYDKLSDLQNSRNPSMTLYAHHGEVLVRVTARANNKAQAANMCTPFLKEIISRLGDCVYGIDVDSLEAAVITHLSQKGLTLAVAESCTGGLLTQKLNLVPGAQNVFKFGVTAHANRVKVQALKVPEKMIRKFGAVSERVALQMACGAAEAGGASVGVGITGVAGATAGETLPSGIVFIAVCMKENVMIKRVQLPPETEIAEIREAAVNHALNMVRLLLDYDPDPAPGAIPLSVALKGKIELCDNVAARAANEQEDPFAGLEEASAPGRHSAGSILRGILIAVLSVLLIAALTFIGYMLYQRYGHGLNGDPSSSSSKPESLSSSSEDSSEPEPEPEDTGEPSAPDDEEAPIGPGFGGGSSSSEAESAGEPAGGDEDAGGDGSSTVTVSATVSNAQQAAQAVVVVSSQPEVSSTVSLVPPDPPPSSSSAPSASSSVAPSSSKGHVVNVTETSSEKPDEDETSVAQSEKESSSSRESSEEEDRGNPSKSSSRSGGEVVWLDDEDEDETSEERDSSSDDASSEEKDSMKDSSSELQAGDVVWLDKEEDGEDQSSSEHASSDDDYFDWGLDGESSSSSESWSGGSTDGGDVITVRDNGKKMTASTKEIVQRVVQAEMGETFTAEALKAQAVAAYTYIQYHLVRGQTPDLILASSGNVTSKVAQAVDSVFGQQVLYNGKPIDATYFASCAGVTNNSEDIWHDSLPYLRSVASGEDIREKSYSISRSEMYDVINEECGVDADGYNENDWISIQDYWSNGEYVRTVSFCGQETKSGEWVRAAFSLPSSAFDVAYDGNSFVFTARGNGHGVGMSQMGAQSMAKDGYGYQEILTHYYSGVSVQ